MAAPLRRALARDAFERFRARRTVTPLIALLFGGLGAARVAFGQSASSVVFSV